MRPRRFACTAVIALSACGAPDYGDPGPTAGQLQYRVCGRTSSRALIALIVDDRPIGTELRAGLGAAVRSLATNVLIGMTLGDPAAWRPIDIGFYLAPPSSKGLVSPADDARLAWTTLSPAAADIDPLVQAVGEHLDASAPEGAFHPLERAKSLASLLTGSRGPSDPAEAKIAALVVLRKWHWVGIAIVAATDDESPDAVASYVYPWDAADPEFIGNAIRPEDAVTPRLDEWNVAEGAYLGAIGVAPGAPFELFQWLSGSMRLNCDGRPIMQSSPGVGVCSVRVATSAPAECVAARGWADPKSGAAWDASGRRICDVLPVSASAMDGCIHDPTCPACGSGYCVTEVQRYECPAGQMPPRLRFVGGALPEDGCLDVTCYEAARRP